MMGHPIKNDTRTTAKKMEITIMVTTTNEIDAVLELKIKGIDALQKLENDYGLKIREIRCDNANENFGLKKEYMKNKMKIEFEYDISFGTPQQKRQVEIKFATLYGQVKAIYISESINSNLRNFLWVEADNITIDLDNFFVNRGINYHHARCSQELRRKDTTKI